MNSKIERLILWTVITILVILNCFVMADNREQRNILEMFESCTDSQAMAIYSLTKVTESHKKSIDGIVEELRNIYAEEHGNK